MLISSLGIYQGKQPPASPVADAFLGGGGQSMQRFSTQLAFDQFTLQSCKPIREALDALQSSPPALSEPRHSQTYYSRLSFHFVHSIQWQDRDVAYKSICCRGSNFHRNPLHVRFAHPAALPSWRIMAFGYLMRFAWFSNDIISGLREFFQPLQP